MTLLQILPLNRDEIFKLSKRAMIMQAKISKAVTEDKKYHLVHKSLNGKAVLKKEKHTSMHTDIHEG